MDRKYCENCNKEIETGEGYYKIESVRTERDYGMSLGFKVADLCSGKCLVEYSDKMRRLAVVRETITENGKTIIRFMWEGIIIPETEIEKKVGRHHLSRKAYEKRR